MRKDIILRELWSEAYGLDGCCRLQNGNKRTGLTLYTRQHITLVNGCQMKLETVANILALREHHSRDGQLFKRKLDSRTSNEVFAKRCYAYR